MSINILKLPHQERILVGIVGILLLSLVVWFIFQIFSPQPMYDSSAQAWAWIDENGNGVRDKNEKPLQGVCVFASVGKPESEYVKKSCKEPNDLLITDVMGQWPPASDTVGAINFFAGAKCSDIWIATVPPDGYEPTTSSVIHSCEGDFGFRKNE